MYPVAEIERLIAPSLASLGYRLVRVRLSGGHRPVLQVMVERAAAQGLNPDVTVDDCAEISHTLSALLDVEDPIRGSYTLEVSSPGIDRPLVRKRDFERFAGFDAKLETRELFDGRRRFKGRLIGVVGEAVRVELDTGAVDLPLSEITQAKLMLSDALIAAAQREKRGRQASPNDD
ncbi:MAG: ribosome maturation factor RimP [Kiloniellales bacterium]